MCPPCSILRWSKRFGGGWGEVEVENEVENENEVEDSFGQATFSSGMES
jgi:hypothetical protein